MNADEAVDVNGASERDSSDDPVMGWRVAGIGMVLVGIPYIVSLPGLVDGVFSVGGLACLVWGWYQIFQARKRS